MNTKKTNEMTTKLPPTNRENSEFNESRGKNKAENSSDSCQETDTNKKHMCEVSGKSFGQKGNLSIHVKKIHLNQKEHKCIECEESFGQKGSLSTHVKTIDLNQKDYKCEECGKNFGQKGNLSRHVKTIHLNQK